MAPGAALRWVLCVHAASFSADRTWKVTWNGVLAGVVITFVGREVGSEILQEGTYPDGKPTRWIFSEITADPFRWRNEISTDRGHTFQLQQHFTARRRSRTRV